MACRAEQLKRAVEWLIQTARILGSDGVQVFILVVDPVVLAINCLFGAPQLEKKIKCELQILW